MRFRTLINMALCVAVILSGVSAASGQDLSAVRRALEQAEKQKPEISVPEPTKNRAAQEAARTFYSPEYQARLKKEIERLRQTVFRDTLKQAGTNTLQSQKAPDDRYFLMPDERIYIFISSSVPMTTLRNYAADLDRLRDPNITMVMRGFVNGIKYFKPTLEFLQKVLVRDPDCDFTTTRCDAFRATVDIDPLVFRRYGIEQVPAILYVRGLSLVDAGLSEGITENAPIADAYMVRGDVSLEYALEKIRKESRSSQLEALLRELRGGFYSERRKEH